MMPDQPTGSFILLDDKKVENDKFKGSSDLFQLHGLTKVAEVVLAGNSKIENYVASLKHFTGLRKWVSDFNFTVVVVKYFLFRHCY